MKNTVTTAFNLAWNLVSDPESYGAFLKYSRWQLIGFFLTSGLLLSLLWSAQLIFRQLPQWRQWTEQAVTDFASHYPEELVVSWTGSHLLLTPSQIYTISYPSFVDPDQLGLPSQVGYYLPDLADGTASPAALASISAILVASPTHLHVENNDIWSSSRWTELFELPEPWSLTKPQLMSKVSEMALSPTTWNQVKLMILASSIPLTILNLGWSWLFQWLLAYLIVVALYRLKITGAALARLTLPITVVASAVQHTAELFYGSSLPISLFGLAFWLILFLVLRSLFFQPKL